MREILYTGNDENPLFAAGFSRNDSPVTAVLMHGGGPDHNSLVPLAQKLDDLARVILPDVRGYGRSVCTDPRLHTWHQYADDVVALLDHLETETAVVGGAGLGGTIALRAAVEHPDRVCALVVISVEDIEDDAAKQAEIAFMEEFAGRVRAQGIDAAWAPILDNLPTVIGSMVRDAIPRSDRESVAAAAAIGYDRSFRTVEELAAIDVPALIVAGADWRHPRALAEKVASILPRGQLASAAMTMDMKNSGDFADALAPEIREFLKSRSAIHSV